MPDERIEELARQLHRDHCRRVGVDTRNVDLYWTSVDQEKYRRRAAEQIASPPAAGKPGEGQMGSETISEASAVVYDLERARRRKSAPSFELPDSLLTCADIFGFDLSKPFTEYHLQRCKEGTQVFIKGGRLTLNLSYCAKVFPPNFKMARQWIKAVADRQGWTLVETNRARATALAKE